MGPAHTGSVPSVPLAQPLLAAVDAPSPRLVTAAGRMQPRRTACPVPAASPVRERRRLAGRGVRGACVCLKIGAAHRPEIRRAAGIRVGIGIGGGGGGGSGGGGGGRSRQHRGVVGVEGGGGVSGGGGGVVEVGGGGGTSNRQEETD